LSQRPRNQTNFTPPRNPPKASAPRRVVHRRPKLPPPKDWRERFERLFTRGGFERNRKWLILLPVIPFVILIFLFCSVVIGFKSPQSMILATKGVEILDRNGQALFTFDADEPGSGRITPLSDVPKSVVDATVATEDANFWSNPGGLSVKGLARAAYENLAFWDTGGLFRGSGGSGITQQLAKNLYIAPEDRASRSPTRKIKEAMYAFELDRRYSKEQIMSWYLSQVNYGHGAYGIEAASFRYFSKPPKDLTVNEAALLAGLPKAPSTYDPLKYPEKALERQKQVLELMVRHGYLDQASADKASSTPLALKEGRGPSETATVETQAPHFAAYVYELLPELLGKNGGGHLRVQTTIDANLQKQAEAILKKQLDGFEKSVGASNGAIVAIDPQTGEILAMAGSHDFFRTDISGQVNNALALNEPGSTMKAITYLAAIIKGWNPSTIVKDEPFKMANGSADSYTLGNADKVYRGDVPVRTALGSSLNVPAVKALEYASLPTVYQLAQRMGVTSLKEIGNYGPAFTLGGVDVSLLDMTYVYSVLAGYGEAAGVPHNNESLLHSQNQRPLDPVAVLTVQTDGNKILYRAKGQKERIVPANTTYLITNMLADDGARASMFGANSALNLAGRPAAVKTGSSDETRDLWAIGYTTQLVAGIWVGNADNKPMGGTSSLVAAPIWREFMTAALKDKPVVQFPVPGGIEFAKVCASTGAAPTNSCKVVTEPFLAGRLPQGVKAEKQETQPAVSQPKTNPTPVPQQAQQPPQQTPFGAGLAATPQPPPQQTPVPPQQTPRPQQGPPVGVTPAGLAGTPRPTVIVTTPVTAPGGPRIPGEPPPGQAPNPTGNRSGF
jgi:membrane peptidoglycan carboxypeptidase